MDVMGRSSSLRGGHGLDGPHGGGISKLRTGNESHCVDVSRRRMYAKEKHSLAFPQNSIPTLSLLQRNRFAAIAEEEKAMVEGTAGIQADLSQIGIDTAVAEGTEGEGGTGVAEDTREIVLMVVEVADTSPDGTQTADIQAKDRAVVVSGFVVLVWNFLCTVAIEKTQPCISESAGIPHVLRMT